jgi:hypothetical protein
MRKSVFYVLLFCLSSCIEILDDISFNSDGSGVFRYTLNLSSSKLKINSILALDSLDGKRVPSKLELQEKVAILVDTLNFQEGISNVMLEEDYENYIFKIAFDFENSAALLDAVEVTMNTAGSDPDETEKQYNWMSWDGHVLIRQIPDLSTFKFRMVKKEDQDLMKNGMYTSISRFVSPVDKIENTAAILSKNNRAVLLRNSLFDVFGDPSIMGNRISVKPTDN